MNQEVFVHIMTEMAVEALSFMAKKANTTQEVILQAITEEGSNAQRYFKSLVNVEMAETIYSRLKK